MYLKYRIHSGGYTFRFKGVYLCFNLETLPFFSLAYCKVRPDEAAGVCRVKSE